MGALFPKIPILPGMGIRSASGKAMTWWSIPSVSTARAGSISTATPPPMTAGLRVMLDPPESSGQWRFPWELGWHNSDVVVSNLAQSDYTVEFRSVPGWLAVETNFVVTILNGASSHVTNVYYPTINDGGTGGNGSLTVNIGPNVLTNSGWRFLGETGWRNPNSTATNLFPDVYLIEFEPVTNYSRPSSRAVQVYPDLPTIIKATRVATTMAAAKRARMPGAC